ncbi:MAG TPA: amino acid permease [Chthoniobacterales bacterium]|jgi:basic amino acid/polyamine antiporter, APA family|nr:amino acid permease [Chthoniobacterales bacterium]
MANLFARKPLERLMEEAQEVGEHSLKRSLGPVNLVALGIGGIIGAGLFVRTAAAIADRAGPSVVLAFIVAGIGCTFAGLCYAEFASLIPVAGSAYTYSYATMGEFVAWIIGWDLILEYAVAASTVAIAWSEYANRVLDWFGLRLPYQWTHSPFEHDPTGIHGMLNIPAVFILLLLTLLLIRGTKESAFVNGLIVVLKVSIVLLFIGIGWGFINPANHTPLIPAATTYVTPQGITHAYGGILGILGAAGVVFFAYIGFDAVSTAAQEARNPKRDMPIGILGSLAFCTVLYVLFSYVLSGVATVQDFRSAGREASVAFAITKYMTGYEWLSKSVTVAILAGFSSVILVMLLGQSRVFFSMSRDGLVPRVFSDVHPRFRTPYKSNMLFFVFTGSLAAFVPADVTGEMTSIGTLFAFILVCAGVWIMRARRPDLERGFRVPAVPVVSTLGIIVCGAMIYGLGWTNWMRLIVWLLIGFVFYFSYGKRHSRINAPLPEMPEGLKLNR